jgi:hypothetical protein
LTRVFDARSLRSWFQRWITGSADDDVLRWIYRCLLVATVTVIVLDYADLQNAVAERKAGLPPADQTTAQPMTAQPAHKDGGNRAVPLREVDAKLRDKMSFDLVGDGRLIATGTITPGMAELFAAEVGKRGSYIKTVVLQSPGGSVRDALAMGRLIREKKFATEIEGGRYCASSCPLVFAGGIERRAGAKAAIGVHQVSAPAADTLPGSAVMEDAQQISAQCQQYLREMGVDLEMWIHAMETPSDRLYYFRPDELLALKLATVADDAKPRSAANR